jgi:hypothetical protein
MMFGIGGFNIGSLISTAMQAASMMTPMGIAMQAAKMLMTQIGMEVIQQLGEKLGLPQPMIDMAQGAFAASAGQPGLAKQNFTEAARGFAEGLNLSPTDQGKFERELSDTISDMASKLGESKDFKEARQSGGKSWLMSLAQKMGEIADKLAGEMDDLATKVGKADKDSKASLNIEFGAKSQEFSQFFSAVQTVVKAVGEALTKGASRQ